MHYMYMYSNLLYCSEDFLCVQNEAEGTGAELRQYGKGTVVSKTSFRMFSWILNCLHKDMSI